jgi:hypothetical protein
MGDSGDTQLRVRDNSAPQNRSAANGVNDQDLKPSPSDSAVPEGEASVAVSPSTVGELHGSQISVGAPGTRSGGLRGMVLLVGNPPPEREILAIKADLNCGPLRPDPVFTRNYVLSTNLISSTPRPELSKWLDVLPPNSRVHGLGNVFVRIVRKPDDAPLPPATSKVPRLLDQVGCLYEPYMIGVVTNEPIQIRNSDAIMHNVLATSKVGNPTFNLAQTRKGQVDTRTFTKPELFVTLQCNVHPWMFAYIGVVENPYFAVTDPHGEFEMPAGLPFGKYLLEFTHRKAGTQTLEVDWKSQDQLVAVVLEVK